MLGSKKDDDAKTTGTQDGVNKANPLPPQNSSQGLSLHKPLPATAQTASTSRLADIPGMGPARGSTRPYGSEGKTLVVGREISLNGEIAACDRLVVEGRVEASLTGCRNLDIAQGGLFKGNAEIEEAEISGRFEGNLTVQKRLRIRSSGHIKGKLKYGQIEIEAGGVISGEVRFISDKTDAKS
ncbi:MAG: polymer-forming cytoskeletal protein [Rhodospirillales bacterium]|jgi:cytoskeletal protein CcmA (bactofilin family)|nr:polymer-forming cytoskeletal protein [Rhodospirillales bacterium]MBT4005585.1 polymer-forming cytoskeletal protein [Rhodospirillales bacterium]MBT5076061.1 polymer-forming cytoskeletal protein [Rhodospirillales bacterium]MBT5112304.1 polymer-forming cytoskeletal protein [Rhodospirillales bacterium]MBT5672005.1 polymer-forming cytoskeletal protein [Rhodospirillales bacterium]